MAEPENSNNEVDFVRDLNEMNMVDITEMIFQSLDFTSLSNAEQVCKVWASAIKKLKVWQKRLNKNVVRSLDWKTIMNSLDVHMLGVLSSKEDIIDHHEYKRACFFIPRKLAELEGNWRNNHKIERRCSIVPPFGDSSLRGDSTISTYNPTNNRSLAFNSRWVITAGMDSKITIRNRFELDQIIHELNIPITDTTRSPNISTVLANENFIVVCFYFHSEVCVWDVVNLNLLFVLDENILYSSLNTICLHENSLLTMHGGGGDVKCTMYNISTNPNIAPTTSFTELLTVKGVSAVFMDKTYICMHLKVETSKRDAFKRFKQEDRIEIRSAHSFVCISVIKPPTFFVGDPHIHYMRGVIIVGIRFTGISKIHVFDAETGACRRSIVYTPQSYMVDLKMIDKFLVICNFEGRLQVWDLNRILNQDENEPFLLYSTMEPTPPFLDYRHSSVLCDGMWIEADDYQVGLIGTFDRKQYFLYIRDFIGEW